MTIFYITCKNCKYRHIIPIEKIPHISKGQCITMQCNYCWFAEPLEYFLFTPAERMGLSKLREEVRQFSYILHNV